MDGHVGRHWRHDIELCFELIGFSSGRITRTMSLALAPAVDVWRPGAGDPSELGPLKMSSPDRTFKCNWLEYWHNNAIFLDFLTKKVIALGCSSTCSSSRLHKKSCSMQADRATCEMILW